MVALVFCGRDFSITTSWYFTRNSTGHPHLIPCEMNDAPSDLSQLPSAPLWRHAFAMLYDTLLVGTLIIAAANVWLAIFGPTESINEPTVPDPIQWASWIVIPVAFFGIFWRRAGQTLGMQAWRIKLVSDSREPLSWHQVIVRVLGAFLAALPLGLGYLWRYVPPRRRYWHDTWSKTHLVLLPKRNQ